MTRLSLTCALTVACWVASCTTTESAPEGHSGATQAFVLPQCANRFAADLDQVDNKQDRTDIECYRQLSNCTSDSCYNDLSACRFGCQKSLQDRNVAFSLRSVMAASHKKCLDQTGTSRRAACGKAQMECAQQAKNDAGETCREGHHAVGSCDKTYAACRAEFDKCLTAYIADPIDAKALGADADHVAYRECMATETAQWPAAAPAPPVLGTGPGVKVVPFMGKTCWESAEPLPSILCGPKVPCGPGLPEVATCYVVQGIPMCCTYCPPSWSADC